MVNWIRGQRYLQLLLGLGVAGGLAFLSLTSGTGQWGYHLRADEQHSVVTLDNYNGDGRKESLTYPSPPSRVLLTYPGATELLITLGLDDKIVGTLKPYGPEPEGLAESYDVLPKLSAPFVPTREEVLDLQPDLIMGWNHHFQPNALGSIEQWYGRGIATYIVPATIRHGHPTIESTLYPLLADVGRIFQVEDRVAHYRAELENRIQRIVSLAQGQSYHPSVLVLQTYGNSTYTSYGSDYVIYDVVEKAGGRMISSRQLNSVGPERILALDPDYIVLVVSATSEEELPKAVASLREDTNLASMRAVQEGRIIGLDFSEVNNGNGRMVDALEKLYQGFYGDVSN